MSIYVFTKGWRGVGTHAAAVEGWLPHGDVIAPPSLWTQEHLDWVNLWVSRGCFFEVPSVMPDDKIRLNLHGNDFLAYIHAVEGTMPRVEWLERDSKLLPLLENSITPEEFLDAFRATRRLLHLNSRSG